MTKYKLVPVKRKEWEDCVNDESGKYDFAFGNVFDAKTGNPVILCIEDGDELLRYKVVKEAKA